MKSFLSILFVATAFATGSAQQVLTELPFGIIIGSTTGEDIENRGTCMKKSSDQSSCAVYDMAGNFFVYTSENSVVNKVRFSAAQGNKLPRKWKELGLNLAITNDPGTQDIDFMNIIKSNGAEYIQTTRDFNLEGEVQGILFTFEIDKLSYNVVIRTDGDGKKLQGLFEMVITEAY